MLVLVGGIDIGGGIGIGGSGGGGSCRDCDGVVVLWVAVMVVLLWLRLLLSLLLP